MKFPVQEGTSRAHLGKCVACGKVGATEPGKFVYLNGGALKQISKDRATMAPDLVGFLSVGVHGSHDERQGSASGSFYIANNVPLGQFEFYFCDTQCLRAFFNACVDNLDQVVRNAG